MLLFQSHLVADGKTDEEGKCAESLTSEPYPKNSGPSWAGRIGLGVLVLGGAAAYRLDLIGTIDNAIAAIQRTPATVRYLVVGTYEASTDPGSDEEQFLRISKKGTVGSHYVEIWNQLGECTTYSFESSDRFFSEGVYFKRTAEQARNKPSDVNCQTDFPRMGIISDTSFRILYSEDRSVRYVLRKNASSVFPD